MRARTLKKKSKQAYDFASKHGLLPKHLEIFKAKREENYHGMNIKCKCKKEMCRHYYHPLKGTWMAGSMEGYYEPEWKEETLYGHLRKTALYSEFSGLKFDISPLLKILDVTQQSIDEITEWMAEPLYFDTGEVR